MIGQATHYKIGLNWARGLGLVNFSLPLGYKNKLFIFPALRAWHNYNLHQPLVIRLVFVRV